MQRSKAALILYFVYWTVHPPYDCPPNGLFLRGIPVDTHNRQRINVFTDIAGFIECYLIYRTGRIDRVPYIPVVQWRWIWWWWCPQYRPVVCIKRWWEATYYSVCVCLILMITSFWCLITGEWRTTWPSQDNRHCPYIIPQSPGRRCELSVICGTAGSYATFSLTLHFSSYRIQILGATTSKNKRPLYMLLK